MHREIGIKHEVGMIRNFAILKLRSDVRPDQIDELFEALGRLRVNGMSGLIVHRDAALRPGNCDVLVVSDLEDEEAYRRYDSDEEHNRIRRELVAPITERAERIQVRF
ncbi:MAG TPA: Dabb family protein [Candidatus Acidoferrum sp.]|nr:Dabb family protein [Candidatus Acidoferrum sp.]